MAQKKVCIHIGSDKAGSTALQAFAFQNAKVLAGRGLHVVSSRHHHHGAIYHELQAGGRATLDKAVAEVRGSAATLHLITFEGFYHLEGRRLQTLVDAFRGFDLRVVFYARRRSDQYRSGIAQQMKLAKEALRDRACEMLFARGFPREAKSLDYHAIVRRWQKALRRAGWSRAFDLRVYERLSLEAGDLIVDFFSRLGVLSPGEPIDEPPFVKLPGVANPSLSPAAQYLMVLTHVFGLDERRRRLVRSLIAGIEGSAGRRGSLVPDAFASSWDERYLAKDSELAREFLGRDTLFLEDPKFAFSQPSGQDFVELIRRLYDGRDQLRPDASAGERSGP